METSGEVARCACESIKTLAAGLALASRNLWNLTKLLCFSPQSLDSGLPDSQRKPNATHKVLEARVGA